MLIYVNTPDCEETGFVSIHIELDNCADMGPQPKICSAIEAAFCQAVISKIGPFM
jgi:hypothetical protein